MKAYFFNFSKRVNSTKQPSLSSGVELDVVLKQPTSIHNPTLRIQSPSFNYNYCYIPEFLTYYWLSGDTRSITNDVWEADFKTDALATFKSSILNSSQFVVYSSSSYNPDIIDSRLTALTTKTVRMEQAEFANLSQSGCYVLAIANLLASGEYGMATYYVCNKAIISSIAEVLYITGNWTDNLVKQFKSVFDSIISCTWVPFDYTYVSVNSGICLINNIYVGDYELEDLGGTPIKAPQVISTPIKAAQVPITIPWAYDDFRNSNPYTSAALYIPMYGLVDVNINDLIGATTLDISQSVDIITGDITLVLSANGHVIQTINYNVGVACPIAQTSNNMSTVLTSIGGSATGLVAAGGAIAAGASGATIAGALVGAAASGANAVLNYQARNISVKGSLTGRSFVAYGTQYKLFLFIQDTENPNASEYIAKMGRPVMEVKTLSNLSGYVQCSDASVAISGSREEIQEVNSYLDSGFYLE